MKATISYSVEIEDIPYEIQNLIKDVQWDLQEKLDELCSLIEKEDFSAAHENINNINFNLQRTYGRLTDVRDLINGYVDVLNQLNSKQEDGIVLSDSYPPGPTKLNGAQND
jgi:hypothetical protein